MIKRTQALPMETISANELKTAGIGAIAKALVKLQGTCVNNLHLSSFALCACIQGKCD